MAAMNGTGVGMACCVFVVAVPVVGTAGRDRTFGGLAL
jgi:hypothetical protein